MKEYKDANKRVLKALRQANEDLISIQCNETGDWNIPINPIFDCV